MQGKNTLPKEPPQNLDLVPEIIVLWNLLKYTIVVGPIAAEEKPICKRKHFLFLLNKQLN